MVYCLTYVSSASGVYDKDIYRQIALQSEAFNLAHDITGMLLIYNETIIQFLEGPKHRLESLYERIAMDDRHRNAFVMSRREQSQREFAQWSMGFEEIVAETESPYLFNLNPKSLVNRFPSFASQTTIALLNGFKNSSGLQARFS